MRIKNRRPVAMSFQFIGQGKTLRPGQLSRELPTTLFYDEHLQHALQNGSIEVVFNDRDVAVAGVAGMPGPVAKALAALEEKKKEDTHAEGGVVTKPVPVVTVTEPVERSRPRRGRPAPGKAEQLKPGTMRASTLAQELHIPLHVLAAGLEKAFGKRVYPLSAVTEEQAQAMREKYLDVRPVPEALSEPSVSRRSDAMSLADLSAASDGVLSLADLMAQNKRNTGAKRRKGDG